MAAKPLFASIVVVVDGTESGIHAARYAVRFAATHSAKIVAIAVVDTTILKSLLSSSVLVESEMTEFCRELEASAQTNLSYVEQLAAEAGVSVQTVFKKGAGHAVITNEVRLLNPDLLVMGSFSSSMIKRDLNARARRLILDEAQCPILLVP